MAGKEKRGDPDQSGCFHRLLHPLRLPHQFAPLDAAEKGVGLEFVDTASSSAQALGGLKLQQLWRKAQSALGRPSQPRCSLPARPTEPPVLPWGTLVFGHQHNRNLLSPLTSCTHIRHLIRWAACSHTGLCPPFCPPSVQRSCLLRAGHTSPQSAGRLRGD